MKQLFLADLDGMTEIGIKQHLVSEYETDMSLVECFDILVAYESVGSWGCDSSSYFLLRRKDNNELFEVRGSHCSCHGFEGQFELEETTIDYLQSDKFYMGVGGYDDFAEDNTRKVKEYMQTLTVSNPTPVVKSFYSTLEKVLGDIHDFSQ